MHIPALISRVRSIGLAGVIVCAAPGLPALAAEPKPDFLFKSKAVEISYSLDAAIKADKPLAANCRADGNKWANERRADAEKMYKDSPESFNDGKWKFERTFAVRSVVDRRYVSIIRADYEFSGGAHPNRGANTVLWDRKIGKRISIRPFFKETADDGPTLKAMREGIIASLKVEKKKRNAEGFDLNLIEAIEPKLTKIGPLALAPSTEAGKSSGLIFHYEAYIVGSYAEGAYVAFVPWESLKPYLTPEGIRIFAGARPEGDDDGRR